MTYLCADCYIMDTATKEEIKKLNNIRKYTSRCSTTTDDNVAK